MSMGERKTKRKIGCEALGLIYSNYRAIPSLGPPLNAFNWEDKRATTLFLNEKRLRLSAPLTADSSESCSLLRQLKSEDLTKGPTISRRTFQETNTSELVTTIRDKHRKSAYLRTSLPWTASIRACWRLHPSSLHR